MASSIPGCLHTPEAPIRGMRLVERSDTSVAFGCVNCGTVVRLPRCAAVAAKTGERCRSATLIGFATCTQHNSGGSRELPTGGAR